MLDMLLKFFSFFFLKKKDSLLDLSVVDDEITHEDFAVCLGFLCPFQLGTTFKFFSSLDLQDKF